MWLSAQLVSRSRPTHQSMRAASRQTRPGLYLVGFSNTPKGEARIKNGDGEAADAFLDGRGSHR